MGQPGAPAPVAPQGSLHQAVSPSFLGPRQGQTVDSEVEACRRPDLITALTGPLSRLVLVSSCPPTEFLDSFCRLLTSMSSHRQQAVWPSHQVYLVLLELKLVQVQFILKLSIHWLHSKTPKPGVTDL